MIITERETSSVISNKTLKTDNGAQSFADERCRLQLIKSGKFQSVE